MENEKYFVFANSIIEGSNETVYLTINGTLQPNVSKDELMLFDSKQSAIRYIAGSDYDFADFDILTNF